jgi:hypothetical protein
MEVSGQLHAMDRFTSCTHCVRECGRYAVREEPPGSVENRIPVVQDATISTASVRNEFRFHKYLARGSGRTQVFVLRIRCCCPGSIRLVQRDRRMPKIESRNLTMKMQRCKRPHDETPERRSNVKSCEWDTSRWTQKTTKY